MLYYYPSIYLFCIFLSGEHRQFLNLLRGRRRWQYQNSNSQTACNRSFYYKFGYEYCSRMFIVVEQPFFLSSTTEFSMTRSSPPGQTPCVWIRLPSRKSFDLKQETEKRRLTASKVQVDRAVRWIISMVKPNRFLAWGLLLLLPFILYTTIKTTNMVVCHGDL